MHLAGDRAAAGARHAVAGIHAGVGTHLVQVLGDRQRVPHRHPVMHQAGHADRRGTQQQFGPRAGIVGCDHLLLEVQPRQPGEQKAAQRPRRVVLAADQKRCARHVASSLDRPVHAALQYNTRTGPADNRMNAAIPPADDVSALPGAGGPAASRCGSSRGSARAWRAWSICGCLHAAADAAFRGRADAVRRRRPDAPRPPFGIDVGHAWQRDRGGDRGSRPTTRRSARCCISARTARSRSRACCWWRRCRATSPRCCAAPSR